MIFAPSSIASWLFWYMPALSAAAAGRFEHKSADQLVVIRMRADPEPEVTLIDFNRERAIAQAYPNGPVISHLLEVSRWTARVAFEDLVSLRRLARESGQATPHMQPEFRRGEVSHSSRERPARCSARASFASASSCPPAA